MVERGDGGEGRRGDGGEGRWWRGEMVERGGGEMVEKKEKRSECVCMQVAEATH